MKTRFIFLLILLVVNIKVYATDREAITLNRISGDIRLDGYVNEDIWKNASQIDNFYTYYPVEGQPSPEKTAVLMGYDQDNLYMAFICFHKDPSTIRATIAKRDDIEDDDYVAIFLDTFDDGKNAYLMAFNPYGIQQDGIYKEYVGEDKKPDFIFESTGRIFGKGYIIEVRLPFRSFKFPTKNVMKWRLGILRKIAYNNQVVVWPKFTQNSTDWIGQFGQLNDIREIKTGNTIGILPEYTAHRYDNRDPVSDVLHNGSIKNELGLNLSFSLSSSLNLDAAYNPDFSQVESDVNKIDVNRVRPIYYSEKRPFFLEGTEIFKTPIQAVYTRQLVEPLGGIKINGRVGDYSIGLLSVLDDYQGSEKYFQRKAEENGLYYWMTEYQDYIDTLSAKYKDKRSINNILRINRNILDNSRVGLLVTDREFEESYNRVYGIDGHFSLSNNSVLTLQGLYSQTQDLLQTEDASGFAYYGTYWWGTNTWNLQLLYNDYSPDFRAENGFISRSDIIAEGFREGGIQLWYNWYNDNSSLHNFRPYIYYSRIYDHDNQLIENNIWPSLLFSFSFKTDLTLTYFYSREHYNGIGFDKYDYSVELSNALLKWLQVDLYYYRGDEIYYYSAPPFLGETIYGTSSIILKPLEMLNFNLYYKYYKFIGRDSGIDYGLKQEIPHIRLNWQISRYFALRYILEHDTYNKYLDLNFLFSYTPSPGTVVYLGYNDFHEKKEGFKNGWIMENYQRQQRGFFLKISYLFRHTF